MDLIRSETDKVSLLPPFTPPSTHSTHALLTHISKEQLEKHRQVGFRRKSARMTDRTPETGPPWQGRNFSNCRPGNKTPAAKGLGQRGCRQSQHVPSPGKVSPRCCFLPLCSSKPVPTPQMRQSKV